MKAQLSASARGERGAVNTYDTGENAENGYFKYYGTKRSTSSDIARLLDNANLTYDDISKALDNIISNNGQENYAAAKRVELVLDDMLSNGYTVQGEYIPANEEYISLKEEIQKSVKEVTTNESAGVDRGSKVSGAGGAVERAVRETAENPKAEQMFRQIAEAGKTAHDTNSQGIDWDESEQAMQQKVRELLPKLVPELKNL